LYSLIDLDTASIDERIAILEDRLRGYFTTPSRLLDNIYENSMLMILLAIFSCVELLESLYIGESSKNKSREFFKSGFRRIYQPKPSVPIPPEKYEADLDASLDELYIQARCGLMHTASPRSKVVIDKRVDVPVAISFNSTKDEVEQIILNPSKALLTLDVYLSEYCSKLRNPSNSDLRDRFNKAWQDLKSEG